MTIDHTPGDFTVIFDQLRIECSKAEKGDCAAEAIDMAELEEVRVLSEIVEETLAVPQTYYTLT